MNLRRSSPSAAGSAEKRGRLSLPRPRMALAGAYVATAALVIFAYAVARATGRPFEDLSKDPVSVLGHAPVYIGFLSNVAVILWAATAAACLLAGITLRRLGNAYAAPLLAAGLISVVFALDDAFLVHERIAPRVGIPQPLVIGAYGLALIFFFLSYRSLLRRTDPRLLAAAAASFAVSVALDFFGDLNDFARSAQFEPFEDTAKLVGLVSWAAYFGRLSMVSLLAAAARPTPDAAVPVEVARASERGRETVTR